MRSSNPKSSVFLTSLPPNSKAEETITDVQVSSTGKLLHVPLQIQAKPRVPWSTGLFDCFSDIHNCCITCWCPCITFGHVAEILDKGSTSCGESGGLYGIIACAIGCPCYYSCFYRSKLRQQFRLHEAETPCSDCLVHCCCEPCALCQEYRQLKHHGFDMTIGWHRNVERRNGEFAMTLAAPKVEEGMSR